MKKYVLTFLLGVMCLSAAWAQRTISGSVSDADTGDPLIGVAVVIKGTTVGMFTNDEGRYALEIPDNATALVFSLVGKTTKEEAINGRSTINVSMETDALELEEVVVTALGISKEKIALGYAVQDVSGDRLLETNTVSAIDALAGQAAGVQITSASGAAGAGSRVVMRGQTSFNGNNEALIVVDGIRLDNSENTSERELNGVANSNRAIDINPDDIESITVLKGGAAAALYGAEGARGVLLITTKKGKAGQGIKVDVKSNYTLSQVNKMHDLQEQFVQGYGELWYGPETNLSTSWGPNKDSLFWDGSDYEWDKNGRIVGASDPNATTPFVPYDNVNDLYQNGRRWQNNVSLSGGSQAITYRMSFGRTDEEGIVPNNTFSRTNLSLGTRSRLLNDRLIIDATINYINSGGQRIQQGSNISGLNLGLLRSPISFDNSNGLADPVNDPSSYQFADGSQRNYRGGLGYDNPYWTVNNAPFTDRVNRAFGSLNATYKVDEWLAFNAKIGGDFYTDNRKQEFELGSRTFPAGQVIEDQWNYAHTDIYLNVMGSGRFADKIGLSYNVGTNFWNRFQKNNYIQGDGFNFVGFPNVSNTQSVLAVIDHTPERNVSFFGSLDLDYDNMLFLTLTGRQDYLSSLINPAQEYPERHRRAGAAARPDH
ncbi:MAG: SusC/RagA family TonB-linked outer membrane protein [Bacteroidota bacterium]